MIRKKEEYMDKKINKCALEMKLTGPDLADLINSHYQDLENWQHSANVALQEGLVKLCKTKEWFRIPLPTAGFRTPELAGSMFI